VERGEAGEEEVEEEVEEGREEEWGGENEFEGLTVLICEGRRGRMKRDDSQEVV
jgi:hypothetical protein